MSIKNLALLESPILSLPSESNGIYFPRYIEERIDQFFLHLENFEGSIGDFIQGNKGKIKDLGNAVINAIKLYYEGTPSKSFDELKSILDVVKTHLLLQKRNMAIFPKDKNFYRARCAASKTYSREEMFHIPFEKRCLVDGKRFSISGLPCLYLSDSVFTCWKELGEEFNELQFCRLEIDYKYLDLSFPPNFIRGLYKMASIEKEMPEHSQDWWVMNYLASWPLILGCYIRAENKQAFFKPQYIIPQMLLEWVRTTEDLDGIKYFSTYADYSNGWYGINLYTNYAIPVKTIAEKGICEKLGKSIKITEPISWTKLIEFNRELDQIIYDSEALKALNTQNFPAIKFLENEQKQITHYMNTKYGKLESELQRLHASSLL